MNRDSVDAYLSDGCGRCDRYKTPQCKVHLWTEALVQLRAILLESGLTEAMKWGSPCYALDGKNVVMLVSRNDYCALSFFKGALLTDERDVLAPPGPNSQAARLLTFTSARQVEASREYASRLITQAIELERSGAKVQFRRSPGPVPDELQARLNADAELRAAFSALTPGRQRSHILHVSGAKQRKTREARVARCVPKILEGRGFNERR